MLAAPKKAKQAARRLPPERLFLRSPHWRYGLDVDAKIPTSRQIE
jgi:hypothetical protein